MKQKLTQQDVLLIESTINKGARAEVGVEHGEITVVELKRKLLSVKKERKTT